MGIAKGCQNDPKTQISIDNFCVAMLVWAQAGVFSLEARKAPAEANSNLGFPLARAVYISFGAEIVVFRLPSVSSE